MMADEQGDAESAETAEHSAGFAEGMSDEPAAAPKVDAGQPKPAETSKKEEPAATGKNETGAAAVGAEAQPPKEPTAQPPAAPELTALEKLHKSAEPAPADVGKAKESPPENGLTDEQFWSAIEAKHRDARQIIGDPRFNDWLAKQDESTQFLATQGGPHGGIAVLNQYKRELAGSQPGGTPATPVDQKAAQEAAYKDLLALKFKAAEGAEKTIETFIDETGDYGNALATVFRRLVELVGGQKSPDLEGLKKELMAGLKPQDDSAVRQEVAEVKFWSDVSAAHSDGRRIWSSKEFKDFWKAQPEHVQRKYARITNPDDAIIILDAFKEAAVKEQAEGKKSKAADKMAKVNGLMKGALKQGAADAGARTGKAEDYGAGFEAAAAG